MNLRARANRDLAQMGRTLRQQNEHFARLWDSGDVARHRAVRKTVHHPLVSPSSEDASRLDLLRVAGTQSFARAD
jgi:hypothetical protein